MKNNFYIILLALISINFFSTQAQENIAESYINQIEGRLDKAKMNIEQELLTSEGKNSALNWFLKGYIDSELAKSEVFKTRFPDAAEESLRAIQTCKKLDINNKYVSECINVLYDISTHFYNNGILSYNNALSSNNLSLFSIALHNFLKFFEAIETLGTDDAIVVNLMEHSNINRYSVVFYTAFSAQKIGENDKAKQLYKQIVLLNDSDEKALVVGVPLAYIYYSELLINEGDIYTALAVIKKGARIYPTDVDVIMAAVDYHRRADQLDEMTEFLELALKSGQNDPKMLSVLGGAYNNIAKEYEKKGYASTALEYRNKAISTYEQALKSNIKDSNLRFNISYNLGIIYFNPGAQAYRRFDEEGRQEAEFLFKKAVENLEIAHSINPKHKNTINMMIDAYKILNNSKRVSELEKKL